MLFCRFLADRYLIEMEVKVTYTFLQVVGTLLPRTATMDMRVLKHTTAWLWEPSNFGRPLHPPVVLGYA